MDITKALAVCAERLQVKPKDVREMLNERPPPPKTPPRANGEAGASKPAKDRDAANRRIVDKARAQLTHTLQLLR